MIIKLILIIILSIYMSKEIINFSEKLKFNMVDKKIFWSNIKKCFAIEFFALLIISIPLVLYIMVIKNIDFNIMDIIKNKFNEIIDLKMLLLIILILNIIFSYLNSLISIFCYEVNNKKIIENDYENILERYLLGNYKSIFINARYGMGKTTLINNCFKRETLKNKERITLEPYIDNNELDYINYLFNIFIEKRQLGKMYYMLYVVIFIIITIIIKFTSVDDIGENLIILLCAVIIATLIKNIKIKREIKKKFIIWNLNRYDYIIIDDIDRCFYDEQIGKQILKIIHFLHISTINSKTKFIVCGDYSNLCDDNGENMIEKYIDNKFDISTKKIASGMIKNQLFEGRQECIYKMYDENDWHLINEILETCSLRSLEKIINDIDNIEPIYLLDNIYILIIKYEQKININDFFEKIKNINKEMAEYYDKLDTKSKKNAEDGKKIIQVINNYFNDELTKRQADYIIESYIIKYQIGSNTPNNSYIDKKIVKCVYNYELLEIIPYKNSVTEVYNNWKSELISNPKEYLQRENLKIIKIHSTVEERLKIVEEMFKNNIPYIYGRKIVEIVCELYLTSSGEFPMKNLALDLKYNLLNGGNYDDDTIYKKLVNLVGNNLNDLSEINILNLLIRERFIQTDFNNRSYYKTIFNNIKNYNIYLKLLLDCEREMNFSGLFADDDNFNKPNQDIKQKLIDKNLYGELIHLLSYPGSWQKDDWDYNTKKLEIIKNKFKNHHIIIENRELIQRRIDKEFVPWNEEEDKYIFKNEFIETNKKYMDE